MVKYYDNQNILYWTLGLPFLREFYTIFNYSQPSVTFYHSVPSRITPDNSASIMRWVIITLVVFSIVVVSVTFYIIYYLYCKNPHRWLNTQI